MTVNYPTAEGVTITTTSSPAAQGDSGTNIRIEFSGVWGPQTHTAPTPTPDPSSDHIDPQKPVETEKPIDQPSTTDTADESDDTVKDDEEPPIPPTPKIPASTCYPTNPFPSTPSEAAAEWERQKREENAENEAIDELMQLVGLEDVKQQVLAVLAKVNICKRQNLDLKKAKERFNVVFQGNPGTGTYSMAQDRL